MKFLKPYILVFLLWGLASTKSHSQSIQSRYEIFWIVYHPIAALKVKHISKHCSTLYAQHKFDTRLDSFTNGGKLDAYRHVLYMAAFAQKIKAKKVKKLGQAHEKGNYRQFLLSKKEDTEVPDSIACEMDLKNNELGIQVGKLHKKLNYQELNEIILSEIQKGNAFIIKRNKNGAYLKCDGLELTMSQFKAIWAIPKCMVGSNYTFD